MTFMYTPRDPEALAELTRRALCTKPFEPKLLLDAMSSDPHLSVLLDGRSRSGHHSLRDHTYAVLGQYERYFAEVQLPGVSSDLMRVTFAYHDIGKYLAAAGEAQHGPTMRIINAYRSAIPLDEEEFALMRALIDGDPLGAFLKNSAPRPSKEVKRAMKEAMASDVPTMEEVRRYCACIAQTAIDRSIVEAEARSCAAAISVAASSTGRATTRFYRALVAYYQSDVAAHTVDATLPDGRRGSPSLEFVFALREHATMEEGQRLFEFDQLAERIRFSDAVYPAIDALERYMAD